MKVPYLIAAAAVLMFSGCVRTIAISTVGGIVEDGFEGFTGESDLEFAGQALPGNLKLLEVMLKNDPGNERLLRLVSEGYCSYALGFVEDVDNERAKTFYLRGRDYALRILREEKDLARALDGPVDGLRTALNDASSDLVPAAFWAAFGWGAYINLSLTNPDALADLPRAEALMDFVAKRDSTYYYGGAHVFLGTLYGSRSEFLGGNMARSRQHFETALRINGGTFLMTYVYFARSYAVQTLDEQLFDELLTKVLKSSLEILPEFRLANAIAKQKAEQLIHRKAELF